LKRRVGRPRASLDALKKQKNVLPLDLDIYVKKSGVL
jgi:hypothetical protein